MQAQSGPTSLFDAIRPLHSIICNGRPADLALRLTKSTLARIVMTPRPRSNGCSSVPGRLASVADTGVAGLLTGAGYVEGDVGQPPVGVLRCLCQ